jgi:hypothetical protein
MQKTTAFQAKTSNEILVDTAGLMACTHAGRATAVKIGTEANARVQIGRRVFWNVGKVRQYIDQIAE